jgi:hypothetical protein
VWECRISTTTHETRQIEVFYDLIIDLDGFKIEVEEVENFKTPLSFANFLSLLCLLIRETRAK